MIRRALPLVFALAACEASSPAPDPPATPTPTPTTPDPSAQRLRRLSPREIAAAYEDLLGEPLAEDELLAERLRYDNGPALSQLQTDQAARLEVLAWRAADAVVDRVEPKLFAQCNLSGGAFEACRDRLVDDFAPRAYRRPLTNGERERLLALYATASGTSGPSAALRAMIAAILQAPAFLYREELGAAAPDGSLRLGPWEIASALSFFVTGRVPDDALRDSAARGDLGSSAGRRQQASRLLATPPGRVQLRTFLREWLAVGDLPLAVKTSRLRVSAAQRESMRADLDAVLDDVLAHHGTLRELLTTTVAFPDASIADTYGVPASGSGPTRVDLDPSTRAGILTRAGFLTVHSAADHSGPIARGLFVLDALLCRPPSAPPSGIPRLPPFIDAAATTRERFALHSQSPACRGCHRSIDGIGFGFEEFEANGRHRVVEGQKPVDTSGVLEDSALGDLPFVGVSALERRLLEGSDFRSCFTRQTYRFAMGLPENARAAQALADATRSFSVDAPLEDLVLTIVESDLFVVREAAE